MPKDRAQTAYRVRVEAADLARHRPHPDHRANGDEERYASAHYLMSFTKGLRHDPDLGVVAERPHFEAFRSCIDGGFVEPFTTRVPVPRAGDPDMPDCPRRMWEAPTAGVVYGLQGPDAQAVTMPPAPGLCSDELAFEMAEVYELSLLRDVPLLSFDQNGGPGSGQLNDAIDRLNAMPYMQNGMRERNCGAPGRPRKTEADKNGNCVLTRQTAFRGSSPGVEKGPYLSQFMWIGSGADVGAGQIGYGAQWIDQRVPMAEEGDDHMKTWEDWLVVQNGFNVNTCGLGQNNKECSDGQNFTDHKRFIYTPRDLATYVHFDALYQAYLNATLILWGMGTPSDAGFASLSGGRPVFNPANGDPIAPNAGGFALFGGPHILSLVTEVATRALKAVRYQKFNTHLRLRPEALAARIGKAEELEERFPQICGCLRGTRDQMGKTLDAITSQNPADPNLPNGNTLLPMAFAEGSPMHPTYGAGHATVAGACTTIVKAFFDCGTILGRRETDGCGNNEIGFFHDIVEPIQYEAVDKGKKLEPREPDCPLTLEGELNKLAANISIGRNMAGVHYFSDYYDSLRMGEEIAIGLLEEQALCYPTDDFVLSVPTFDGEIRRIGRK